MLSLSIFAIFVFSNVAHADIYEKHQEICESPEAKEMMGEEGACKVLVVPHAAKSITGMCAGRLKSLTCIVKFASVPEGTSLNLTCGNISQVVGANIGAYKVGGQVKMENGKNNLLVDPREFITITSKIASMNFTQIEGSIKEPSIEINFGFGGMPLTNVLCI